MKSQINHQLLTLWAFALARPPLNPQPNSSCTDVSFAARRAVQRAVCARKQLSNPPSTTCAPFYQIKNKTSSAPRVRSIKISPSHSGNIMHTTGVLSCRCFLFFVINQRQCVWLITSRARRSVFATSKGNLYLTSGRAR
jgi:hypothetical protein